MKKIYFCASLLLLTSLGGCFYGPGYYGHPRPVAYAPAPGYYHPAPPPPCCYHPPPPGVSVGVSVHPGY